MKKFKQLLLIGVILNIAMALVLPSTVIAAGETVSIDAPAEVGPDTSFIARVSIADVTNLDACNYDVTYDPSVLEVTDITSGLIGTTAVPVGMWAEVASGKIRVIENIPGVSGVTGSGYLAEIHFHVIGTSGSTSTIGFSGGTLSSGSATEITASWAGDSINVISLPTPTPSPISPTPTPTPISSPIPTPTPTPTPTPVSSPIPTPTPTPTPCTGTTPAKPALMSPLNRATGLGQTLTMQWKVSTGAQWYHLQVSAASNFATTVLDVDQISSTTYDIPTGKLNWNTRYYWRVSAGNCGGASVWTSSFYFNTALGPPPADPSNLIATPISSSQIDLTWQDTSNNETGFKIERRTGTGAYTEIATVGANVVSYSNTGLTATTTYYYQVRAYNRNGNSNYCTEANAKTLPLPPPVPVLTSPASGATGMDQAPRLAWNPSAGALNYSVQLSTVSNFATIVINQAGVTNSFFDVAPGVLSWNTRYYWRVNVVGASGSTSAWTAARYFTTALGPPPADPSNLTAAPMSSLQINLTWQDTSNNETGFKIERRNGTGAYTEIGTVGANVVSYSNTGLTANTTYYYRVRSYSAAGNSNYSTEANAKTLPLPPPVPVLTSPASRATGMNQAPRLAWNPSTGAVNYSLQVSTVSTFATMAVNITGISNTSYTLPSGVLSWNTKYYWRVNAVGASGSTSAWSTLWYFRTALGPY